MSRSMSNKSAYGIEVLVTVGVSTMPYVGIEMTSFLGRQAIQAFVGRTHTLPHRHGFVWLMLRVAVPMPASRNNRRVGPLLRHDMPD